MARRAIESQTLNIHGGVGGNGGRSRLGRGGGGGNGESPQLHYEINAGYLTMNNNVLSTLSGQPQSQFRAVNLGDLHLLEEIDTRKVVKRGPTHQRRKRMGSVTVQRIYSARIFGSQDPMTAIVYDGPKFEQRLAEAEEKQRHRNPFLTQLFGFTCSTGLNALIYHDGAPVQSQTAEAEIPAIPIANHFTPSSIHVKAWCSSAFRVKTLPTGWTRVEYLDSHHRLRMKITLVDEDDARKWWFSQLGYVRAQLQDAISFDDEMVFVIRIGFDCSFNTPPDNFTLQGTFMAAAPTDDVYLFIFSPKVDLVDGRFILTSPPAAERYYWAFDPAGLDRLTCQAVEDLGLPVPEFSTWLGGARWDKTRHNMVRDFHAAKGFDPCSQDMAIAMGYPLVDPEDIHKFARELTGKHPTDFTDAETEDGIYYSSGLC
ncbi:hypothetical protein B0H19DRAFT_1233144 [Mycena capillaripes]|nr:hypothetical protein B0H19DRAFT_1233144 [Mycena capillaripes]